MHVSVGLYNDSMVTINMHLGKSIPMQFTKSEPVYSTKFSFFILIHLLLTITNYFIEMFNAEVS